MTYFPRTQIEIANSPSADAFGRMRVSNTVTLFDSKQLYDSQELFWSTKIISGSSISHSALRASTTLTAVSSSGSYVFRQTKQRNFYQPGKSLLTFMTFIMGSGVANTVKRIGYFNGSDGIFLEQSGANVNFVVKSSVSGEEVANRVSQSNWNIDPFDGTGPSGFTFDATKAQILAIDFQWLGVGRVRLGFDFSGSIYYGHEFNHSNVSDAVYMSTPNLPLRCGVESFGAANSSSLEHICSSVLSEGGYEPLGSTRGIDRLSTVASSSNTAVILPVLSIRLNPSRIGTVVLPSDFSIISPSNDDFRWALYLNPSVGGTDLAVWTSISGSAVQYDINRNSTNALSGGVLIRSGYVPAGQGGAASNSVAEALKSGYVVGSDVDDNPDELILAVQNVNAGAYTYLGSMGWRELS